MTLFVATRWIAPITGLLGVMVGTAVTAWATSYRERRHRQHEFRERQLKELYSPLLGLRLEIHVNSELRAKISNVADAQWRLLSETARKTADPVESLRRLKADRWPAFEAAIEYSNQQLREELIPSYRRMVQIFRDNIWLAEPDTQKHFGILLEFVAIWEQWLARAIPHEVITELDTSEAKLLPFYEHMQAKHDEIRQRIVKGKP